MKNLTLAISILFLTMLVGLVGLLYTKSTTHLMDLDVAENKFTRVNKIMIESNMEQLDAIFIGNSIVEQWSMHNPEFMQENNYLNRGIGGQTTPQILLRFRPDVIDFKPKVVVIEAGINDIAENTGHYGLKFTIDNIKNMTELAKANNIKVVLVSVLPINYISWNSGLKDVHNKIIELNTEIKKLAQSNGHSYIDFYSTLVSETGGLKHEYDVDGVHINLAAYNKMEPIIKAEIDKLVNN